MPGILRFNNAHALGFEEIEQALETLTKSQADGYPPFNIEQDLKSENGEIRLRVTLAVAGFTPDLLEVTQEGRHLTVKGLKAEAEQAEYLHQGIATRQFQRTFILADTIEVVTARLSDGLLMIELLKPQQDKSIRKIEITTS